MGDTHNNSSVHSSQIPSTSTCNLGGTNEDADFVDAVMSNITPHRVDVDVTPSRKRPLSPTCRSECTELADQVLSKKPRQSQPNMSEIASQISKLESSLVSRMSGLEDRLMDRLKECVMAEIKDIRDTFSDQIRQLSDRLTNVEQTSIPCAVDATPSQSEISRNLVIRNLKDHVVENVARKVDTLIKDGLKVNDITVVSAERKLSRNGKPGVVIAKFKTKEEVNILLSKKKLLRNSDQHSSVYIAQDIPYNDRVHNQNMRTLLNAVGRNQLEMRGSFVVKKSTPPRNTNTRNTEYRRESNDLPNTASDSRHIVHNGTRDTVNGPRTNNPRDNDGWQVAGAGRRGRGRGRGGNRGGNYGGRR